MIAVGKRADLVLVEGNTMGNITTTENLQVVWVAGKGVMLEGWFF